MSKYVITLDETINQDRAETIYRQLEAKPDGPWVFPKGVKVHDLEHGEFYDTDQLHIPDELALGSLVVNGFFIAMLIMGVFA